MDLSTFVQTFHEEVMEDLARYSGNAEEAFVQRFTDTLADNGVVQNVLPGFWQKGTLGIKVNAYSYNEAEHALALFVADWEMDRDRIQAISRTDVEKGLKRAVKFFEYAAAKRLQEYIDESDREAMDLAWLIHDEAERLERLDIYLLTNRIYKRNDVVDLRVRGVQAVQFHIWDMERLGQLVDEMQGSDVFTVDFLADFGESFELLQVPGSDQNDKFDCYVGYVPGSILAKAYMKFGQRLIERNVRSFLQFRGKVNKGIRETLEERSEMFVAYNNGISTTAEAADLTPVSYGSKLFRVDSLTGWQIVNGGQTTASLYHAWKDDIDLANVYVQAKLTVLKTKEPAMADDLIARISEYANTQNKISFSDLNSNNPVHVGLQQISRTVWAPDPLGRKAEKKWYYERANGQYLVDLSREPTAAAKNKFKLQNPKNQVITKTKFAKYFMAWEQLPHVVSRGSEDNFTEFMRLMAREKPEINSDFYKQGIARGLLFTCCDEIVRKMNLPGYKANVVYYTVALTSLALSERFSLMSVWNAQAVPPEIQKLLAQLAEVTWEYLSNPPSVGTNISQWCKKEECWTGLKHKASQALKGLSAQATKAAAPPAPVKAAKREPANPEGGYPFHQPVEFLQEHSLRFIDRRDRGGALWVLHEPRAKELMAQLMKLGYHFRFSPEGNRVTQDKPAWWWKA